MSGKIKGLDKLMRKLEQLERAGARRAMRKATRVGTNVLKAAVKSETPVDEGQLKRAQDSKVSGRGLSFSGVVGANVAKLEADSAAEGVAASGEPKRPTNIDYLVEYGHVTPDGTVVPPSGHMRRAADKAMPAAEAAYARTLAEQIEAEAMK